MYTNWHIKKDSLEEPFACTLDWALLYVVLTKRITHSSTPSFLKLHRSILRGTLSKAFSRSTEVAYIVFRFKWCFFCICVRIKIVSVVFWPSLQITFTSQTCFKNDLLTKLWSICEFSPAEKNVLSLFWFLY